MGYPYRMRGARFKKRALQEGQRYGEDKLVFLRELSQNSRDAKATRITVRAKAHKNQLILRFEDNGTGMGYHHAKKYLFTLYASSKERQSKSAGRFGVGFWSILLFDPSSIKIESHTTAGHTTGIALDGHLDHPREVSCSLSTNGTRITLVKSLGPGDDGEGELKTIEQALRRYCPYLRQNNRSAAPLSITFNGTKINRTFSIDGPCWMSFRKGSIQGAVGLGDKPRVELYARGLLVWRGTILDELRYGAKRSKQVHHPDGLAPVYMLNGNDLNVTLDRRAVVDDRALARVRSIARKKMRTLLRRYLDGVAPRSPGAVMADLFSSVTDDLQLNSSLSGVMGTAMVAIVLVAAFALGIGSNLALSADKIDPSSVDVSYPRYEEAPMGSPPGAQSVMPLSNNLVFEGPAVDSAPITERIQMKYTPKKSILFRLSAHEQLDGGTGIVARRPKAIGIAPDMRCTINCVDVELEINARPGNLAIPIPTGHMVEPRSVRLNGRPVESVALSSEGDPLLLFETPTQGKLKYRTGPLSTVLSEDRRVRLLKLPASMTLPPELEAVAIHAAQYPGLPDRVEAAYQFVKSRLLYDRSPATAAAHLRFLSANPTTGWLDFVFRTGRGDCDVKNTVLMALLRQVGVPARLAVGLVGVQGRVMPGAHAWVEYYDNRWRTADATGKNMLPTQTPSPTGPTPDPVLATGTEEQTEPEGWTVLFGPGHRLKTMAVGAAVTSMLFGLFALVLLVFGKSTQQLFTSGDREARYKVAAKMLTHALIHRDSWRMETGLARRKLLPMLGTKKRMSLVQATKRGRRGTLWFSNGKPSLATGAVKRGAAILDIADPTFAQVVSRLPGIVSLDEIAHLKPIRPRKAPDHLKPIGDHLSHVNRLLSKSGIKGEPVFLSEVMTGALSRDVDLRYLPVENQTDWPKRFIAVRADSHLVQLRTELGKTEPELAAFLTLDLLLTQSRFLQSRQRQIRIAAAQNVLGTLP